MFWKWENVTWGILPIYYTLTVKVLKYNIQGVNEVMIKRIIRKN